MRALRILLLSLVLGPVLLVALTLVLAMLGASDWAGMIRYWPFWVAAIVVVFVFAYLGPYKGGQHIGPGTP